MQFAFDLISDLHLDAWRSPLNWSGKPTSPHCVVAGDVCQDRGRLLRFLQHLGTCYQAVFYIDGNDEHKLYMDQLSDSYQGLVSRIRPIANVVYLQDNMVIISGVAIVATNGWWGFDLDGTIDPEQAEQWLQHKMNWSPDITHKIRSLSNTDAAYMIQSIRRLQTHPDVRSIVVVSHTVPRADLIHHDVDLANTMKFNCMGNKFIAAALEADTERKIHTWCFGHYHGKVDQIRDGVRWVNNCRGREGTQWSQWVYNPLRIEIDH